MVRKSLPKKTRFEVFKRDSFTCQYCGRSAPDVVLHVDHIAPVSEGGDDDITNLITSCRDCNLGKSNRQLDDHTVVKQRKRQLDELQERREQLEMMMEWQRSLLDLEEQLVSDLSDIWDRLVPGYTLNENGARSLRLWLGKYETQEIIEAMRICTSQYLSFEKDKEKPTQQSVEKAWRYVPKVCNSKRAMKEKPYLKDLFYIRGILRNRLTYVNEWESLNLLEQAVQAGISTNALQEFAKQVSNWTNFRTTIQASIDQAKAA